MATTRQQKETIIADITNEFQNSNSTVFTAYSGLTVAEIQELRKQLSGAGSRMLIAKKTLIQLAAKNAGLKEIPVEALEGPIAVIFSHADELSGYQLLHKFGEDHGQISITGGIFDGEMLGKARAQQLARLPGRPDLLGQLVGLLISPLRGFVGIGNALVGGLVRVLDAAREKQESAA
ncbi:MAG: 50S ribosomal protein L10 [Patescibacteria group bacterium]